MTASTPLEAVKECMRTLDRDLPTLKKVDRYLRGEHDEPYIPDQADAEYRMLAKRCVTNLMPFAVSTSAQTLYVDGFRRGSGKGETGSSVTTTESGEMIEQPEWLHWQKSRLDARQAAIYRGALTFGHSFVVTEMKGEDIISRGLSAMRTVALYDDPANDDAPRYAFTVTKWPSGDGDKTVPGEARLWDERYVYDVTFKSLSDTKKGVRVDDGRPHGADECPVTRFHAGVDLEGRTRGLVEQLFRVQDRLNQTVFDLLVVQTFASFKVRTVSGMAPPMQMELVRDESTGESILQPKLDADGNPIPKPVNFSAKRMLMAEDHETKFGTLEETSLEGFIESIRLSFQHISSLANIPPHHLMGQIANLSADALTAAETALMRKVAEFRSLFGESWERVFRIAASMAGDTEGVEDYAGEVVWRDTEHRSLSQSGDALGKLSEALGIPPEGLWARVPGVTATEMKHWEELKEKQDSEAKLAESLDRVTSSTPSEAPSFRQRGGSGRVNAEVTGDSRGEAPTL